MSDNVKDYEGNCQFITRNYASIRGVYLLWYYFFGGKSDQKKSRIRETPTLSTDAGRRTDTNLKRLRDLSKKTKFKKKIKKNL